MSMPIGDYAIIGDGRSVALVSRAGSIDWLCWPRVDSPSLFAALLDERAGCWSLAPTTPFLSSRAYVDDTNVLVTRFETTDGTLTLTDLMPVADEDHKRRALTAEHELLRVVRCERGSVELEMRLVPRPGYGGAARVRDLGPLGVRVDCGSAVLFLRSELPMVCRDGAVHARAVLRAGDARAVALSFAADGPAVLPPLGIASYEAVARSIAWWRGWARRIRYDGPVRAAVVRSALAVKLLIYSPSGAILAAPTTSLPERPGGDLNWDYRFCWLRDASMTARALVGLGFADEAEAFVSWLLHSTRRTRPRLKILYDVFGNPPPRERTLPSWRGHDGARPVRTGNAAVEQLQLDVYGEVVDATAQLVRAGMHVDHETRRMLVGFGRYLLGHWREPDEGIWEPRSGRAPHTHSRLLSWTAFDRLLALHEKGLLGRVAIGELAQARDEIRRELETRAWNPRLGSYVATLDGDDVDATLLLLGYYGFADASSPRLRATHARVLAELDAGDGLLYRYRNGDSPGEGAFGICGFWNVDHLARAGAVAEAERFLQRLVGHGNDVGLFAEEIDPESGAAWGNFPQAFTHVGLINAALTLLDSRRAQTTSAATMEAGR